MPDATIEAVLAGTYNPAATAPATSGQVSLTPEQSELWSAVARARQVKDWTLALSKLDELENSLPQENRLALSVPRFQILLAQKNYDAAYKTAEATSDALPGNAFIQTELSAELATDPSIEKPNLDLAEKIANRALDATQGQNGDALNTLATIAFLKGKKDNAISLEQRALELAQGGKKEAFERSLECFQKGPIEPGASAAGAPPS